MAALDEARGDLALTEFPALLGLDEVGDDGFARVPEGVPGYRPLPEHVQQGLLGRVFAFFEVGSHIHGVPHKFGVRGAVEVLESLRRGEGAGIKLW